jgi:hypothetical protein
MSTPKIFCGMILAFVGPDEGVAEGYHRDVPERERTV